MKKIAIIGAGLAGTAAAWALKQAGADPIIYEAGGEIAPGASGNPVGLYNPRLSAERGFYSDAFPAALRVFENLRDIDWNRCGALHLMTDEVKRKRFHEAVKNWGWSRGSMKIVSAGEASGIAGVKIGYEALWLPDSGTVSPKKLCERFSAQIPVRFNVRIDDVRELKADAVIRAAGMATKNMGAGLPLKAVRGQLTQVHATDISKNLKCNLCYGGYFSPARDGVHTAGATFQRWLDHAEIIPEDDLDNIGKLAKVAPGLAEGLEVAGSRAAVRATTPDHFPLIGEVGENMYVSAGHGSHGIISSIAAAQILTAMILDRPMVFARDLLNKVRPERFKV